VPQHFEVSSSTLQVEVEGQQLPSEVMSSLMEWVVDDSLNVPDMFELVFVDDTSHKVLEKGNFKIGAKVKLKIVVSGTAAPKPLMEGEVTALEAESNESEAPRVIVRGFDHSHRLFRGKRIEAYLNLSPDQIVRKVAQRAGINVGDVSYQSAQLKHVAQDGINDWDFLRRLADQVGADVTVADGKLNFKAKTNASSAPSTSQDGEDNPLVLDRLNTLVSVRSTITAADQVPEVEVRGWDPQTKKEVIAKRRAETVSAKVDGITPTQLADTFKSPPWVECISSYSTQDQVDKTAQSISERLAGAFAEIDGVARGNPALRSGTAVALANVGKPFDGKYTISQSKHIYTLERGYLTYVTVSNLSDRNLYGITIGGASRPPTINGVVVGVVDDVKDPDKKFRVKVRFPVLSGEFVSTWARTLQTGAGPKRGFVVLPEVGDEVLVGFGMGSFDEPYVLGGLYNGKDEPDKGADETVDGSSGEIKRRAWVSRTGMLIEMLESTDGEKLVLSSNDGKQSITLTQTGDKGIEILSEGPVTIKAQKDINIETDTGDLTIKAKAIKMESTADLELKAGAGFKAKGVNAEISGDAQVKVKGAMASLEGSGVTEVKGGLVKIN